MALASFSAICSATLELRPDADLVVTLASCLGGWWTKSISAYCWQMQHKVMSWDTLACIVICSADGELWSFTQRKEWSALLTLAQVLAVIQSIWSSGVDGLFCRVAYALFGLTYARCCAREVADMKVREPQQALAKRIQNMQTQCLSPVHTSFQADLIPVLLHNICEKLELQSGSIKWCSTKLSTQKNYAKKDLNNTAEMDDYISKMKNLDGIHVHWSISQFIIPFDLLHKGKQKTRFIYLSRVYTTDFLADSFPADLCLADLPESVGQFSATVYTWKTGWKNKATFLG